MSSHTNKFSCSRPRVMPSTSSGQSRSLPEDLKGKDWRLGKYRSVEARWKTFEQWPENNDPKKIHKYVEYGFAFQDNHIICYSCAAIHKSSPDSSDAPEPTDLGLHEIWCDVFHNEKLRQESFSKYETNSDEIKQKLLKFAKQGFVYRRKEIICYCCKARLDNPLEQNPNDKSLHTPKCKRFRKIGCLDVTKWKDRLETFNNHPSKELLNIRKIAENGFFYGEKNRIKCFSCEAVIAEKKACQDCENPALHKACCGIFAEEHFRLNSLKRYAVERIPPERRRQLSKHGFMYWKERVCCYSCETSLDLKGIFEENLSHASSHTYSCKIFLQEEIRLTSFGLYLKHFPKVDPAKLKEFAQWGFFYNDKQIRCSSCHKRVIGGDIQKQNPSHKELHCEDKCEFLKNNSPILVEPSCAHQYSPESSSTAKKDSGYGTQTPLCTDDSKEDKKLPTLSDLKKMQDEPATLQPKSYVPIVQAQNVRAEIGFSTTGLVHASSYPSSNQPLSSQKQRTKTSSSTSDDSKVLRVILRKEKPQKVTSTVMQKRHSSKDEMLSESQKEIPNNQLLNSREAKQSSRPHLFVNHKCENDQLFSPPECFCERCFTTVLNDSSSDYSDNEYRETHFLNDEKKVSFSQKLSTSQIKDLRSNYELSKEICRLATFDPDWHSSRKNITPSALAENGFFYLNLSEQSEHVQCCYCGKEVDEWDDDDNIKERHRTLSPDCIFVLDEVDRRNTRFVPPQSDVEAPLLESQKAGTQPRLRSSGPCHPDRQTDEARFKTFVEKCTKLVNLQVVVLFVKAGFFYFGEEDRVKCFFCSGELDFLESVDNPLREHAKKNPRCENVLKSQKEFGKSNASSAATTGSSSSDLSRSGESPESKSCEFHGHLPSNSPR